MRQSPVDKIVIPVERFLKKDYAIGLVLLLSIAAALLWANFGNYEAYAHLWHTRVGVNIAAFSFQQPLHIWINDALMSIFFFHIGLELKREFMIGELSSLRKAILPMGAALGGMIFPALIYLFFNYSGAGVNGWGIPMATDIAFALALLTISGKHIPLTLKIFLSALAVADDMGAVLVIAFFYTANISWMALGAGFLLLGVMVAMNLLGFRRVWLFYLVGTLVWLCFFYSGIHATIAGVLTGFMIPARTKIDEAGYSFSVRKLIDDFDREMPLQGPLTTNAQHLIIQKIKWASSAAETPLQKIEHGLHYWVMFLILPLFAFSNAGLQLSGNLLQGGIDNVMLGIFFGLLFGKIIGITGFTYLLVKLKLADLPEGVNFRHIFGVSILGGVGFTMSLFISNLAFSNPALIDSAKYSILITSAIAGLCGVFYLKSLRKKKELKS